MAATSTAARVPEAAQPVGDALPPRRRRRTPVWASQRALKVTMAITGTIMALFVVVHMVGNLKVLAGP
ncbi:succinate dehydrogenase, partial [Actinomyces oris]